MKHLIPVHNLLVVSIKKSVSDGADIYNAARYAWRLKADRARQADYVLAHQSGTVVGVFEADEWLHATDDAFKGMGDFTADDNRWGFVGRVAPSEVLIQYFGKQLPEGFIKRGASNPVRFIFLDDAEKNKDDSGGLPKPSSEVEEAAGHDAEETGDVSYDVIIDQVNVELSRIISENKDEFNSSEQTKVRPGYGPDKFYLDKIDGAYDSSLQSLIHYILWEKKLYHKFLTERQLLDVTRVINDEPDNIYRPDLDDESTSDEEFEQDQALDESLDTLYWQVITHVGEKLSEFDFFDNSEFDDNGYVESDDD